MEIIGKQVLLKDENGEAIIPYVNMPMPHNVGDIFFTSRLDTELNGAVECNGGTYSTLDFSGKQSIGDLLSGGSLPYVRLSEYESIVSTNGSCRAFGWDGGTSFRVPTLKDVYIEAGTAETAGEFISESLPNITGSVTVAAVSKDNTGLVSSVVQGGNTGTHGSGTQQYNNTLNFDASNSSPTYQDGAKVKPDSVRYRAMVQLANEATDEALITATSALQQVSSAIQMIDNKVDKTSSTDRETVVGWGIPDYSAGVSITQDTEYTADCVCYIYLRVTSSSSSGNQHVSKKIVIDGVEVTLLQAHQYNIIPIMVLCPKGSTYQIQNVNTGTGSYEAKVYPIKGVNQ